MAAQIWEKQSFESSKQFKAFCAYRNMGPSRSLAKASAKINQNKYYVKMLEKWSVANHWVMRCEAYDAHMEAERQKRMEQAFVETPVQQLDITNGALATFVDMFNRRVESGEVDDLEMKELAKYLLEFMKFKRKVVGMPDEMVEMKHDITAKVRQDMTNDELLKNPLIAELVCAATDLKEMGTTDLKVKEKKQQPVEQDTFDTENKKTDDGKEPEGNSSTSTPPAQ